MLNLFGTNVLIIKYLKRLIYIHLAISETIHGVVASSPDGVERCCHGQQTRHETVKRRKRE
jgi:hypothetical protein